MTRFPFFEKYAWVFNRSKILVLGLILEGGAGWVSLNHRHAAKVLHLGAPEVKEAIDWLLRLNLIERERHQHSLDYRIVRTSFESFTPRAVPTRRTLGSEYQYPLFNHIPLVIRVPSEARKKLKLSARVRIDEVTLANIDAIRSVVEGKAKAAGERAGEKYQTILKEIDALKEALRAEVKSGQDPQSVTAGEILKRNDGQRQGTG